MDPFIEYKRHLKWELYKDEIPEELVVTNNGGGTTTASGLSNGGIGRVRLHAPNNSDSNVLDTPYFRPLDFDEIRFKVFASRNVVMNEKHIIRIGLYSANDVNGIYFANFASPQLRRSSAPYKFSSTNTPYGTQPVWFEIVWKPQKNVIKWYLDQRFIGESTTDNPDRSVDYRGCIQNINQETPSTVAKNLDIYTIELELLKYTV